MTYTFRVPGEENAHVMMSLEDSNITFVLGRHEQSEAFIVDAYGRLTGKAWVCLDTLDPNAKSRHRCGGCRYGPLTAASDHRLGGDIVLSDVPPTRCGWPVITNATSPTPA